MQSNALHELYKLEGPLKEKGDPVLLDDWRREAAAWTAGARRYWLYPE